MNFLKEFDHGDIGSGKGRWFGNNPNEKRRSKETQTLRAGCSKAEPKIFVPAQTPFLGAQDGQNLISWRWSLPYLQTQFGEDRCTQFRVIVVTDPHTNKVKHKPTNPQTGPITIHCIAASAALLQPARSVCVSLSAFFIPFLLCFYCNLLFPSSVAVTE